MPNPSRFCPNKPMKAFLLVVHADLPALAKFLHFQNHNAYHGCPFCLSRGMYSTENRHVFFPHHVMENGRKKQMIPYHDISYRTHDDTVRMAEQGHYGK
jgi:hypothetical protein